MKKFYIDESIYKYPHSYKKLVNLNLLDFELWYLIEAEQATRRYYELQKRYNRNLIPFARRDDNDDIACFEIGKGNKVQLIHDFSSSGFEQRREFDDIWEWVMFAITEMIDYYRIEEI